MNTKNSIKPLWYLDEKTIITILMVIKNFNEHIKKEVITIIATEKDKENYHKFEVNYNHEIMNNILNNNISFADYL